jgi:diguanylate cyclase (GGDEF)-like protein
MQSIKNTAARIAVRLLRPWSLGARVYAGILVVALSIALYFSYSWYSQKRLAGITHDILDKRIVVILMADRIKETMLSDQASLLHYAATRDSSDLQEFSGLGRATIEQMDALRRETASPEIHQELDLLQTEVQDYFAQARKLVGLVNAQDLPPKTGLFKAARWAHDRPQALKRLDFASGDSRIRLARINALCDELIVLNQRALQDARQDMNRILAAGARDARLAGLLVGLILLLVAIGHLRSILGPLRALIAGIKRVEEGDLGSEIPIIRQDEIGKLTLSFNRMTRRILEQREQLVQLTITDGLTGLYNLRHFRVILKQEMDRARRTGHPFSLLMIDVDHFKPYNDSQGHEAGNELLKAIASILKETVRDIDAAARYGGDEFAVVLPNASEPEARTLAERIEKGAAADGRATLSIGGATFPRHASSMDDLLRRSDEALYAAKRAGRGCIRWSDAPAADPPAWVRD